jgi:hypothetical protein
MIAPNAPPNIRQSISLSVMFRTSDHRSRHYPNPFHSSERVSAQAGRPILHRLATFQIDFPVAIEILQR